jgi:hypothetical protein
MQLRTLIRLPIVLAAILAAAPAHAELYKWVDARGVTNYSNQPPADPAAAKKLTAVEDRISVYTPDKALLDAVEASRQQRNNRAVAAKIASLEQQLEDERRARQYAAADAQPAHDPLYSSHHYVPVPVFVPARSRPLRNVAQVQLPPGTIAGNIFPSRHLRSTSTSREPATR